MPRSKSSKTRRPSRRRSAGRRSTTRAKRRSASRRSRRSASVFRASNDGDSPRVTRTRMAGAQETVLSPRVNPRSLKKSQILTLHQHGGQKPLTITVGSRPDTETKKQKVDAEADRIEVDYDVALHSLNDVLDLEESVNMFSKSDLESELDRFIIDNPSAEDLLYWAYISDFSDEPKYIPNLAEDISQTEKNRVFHLMEASMARNMFKDLFEVQEQRMAYNRWYANLRQSGFNHAFDLFNSSNRYNFQCFYTSVISAKSRFFRIKVPTFLMSIFEESTVTISSKSFEPRTLTMDRTHGTSFAKELEVTEEVNITLEVTHEKLGPPIIVDNLTVTSGSNVVWQEIFISNKPTG